MSHDTAGNDANAASKPTRQTAVLLTLLLGPGVGHFYAGEIARGTVFAALPALVGAALIWLDVRVRFAPVLQALGLSLLGLLAAWLASAIDLGRGPARFRPSSVGARIGRVLAWQVGVVCLAITTSLSLRVLVVEAFKVPSSSMTPTLLLGDSFFVDKRAHQLVPGEVIVFASPEQPTADFVKRVVARGNDVVSVDGDGLPTVNGVPARRCALGRAPASAGGPPFDYFLETLGGRSYLVVLDPAASTATSFARFAVPGDAVFVLGDNRHNSYDSRLWNGGEGGAVPLSLVKGPGFGIWFSSATLLSSARDRALETPLLPPFAAALQPALDACPK